MTSEVAKGLISAHRELTAVSTIVENITIAFSLHYI